MYCFTDCTIAQCNIVHRLRQCTIFYCTQILPCSVVHGFCHAHCTIVHRLYTDCAISYCTQIVPVPTESDAERIDGYQCKVCSKKFRWSSCCLCCSSCCLWCYCCFYIAVVIDLLDVDVDVIVGVLLVVDVNVFVVASVKFAAQSWHDNDCKKSWQDNDSKKKLDKIMIAKIFEDMLTVKIAGTITRKENIRRAGHSSVTGPTSMAKSAFFE